jgi:hypothetical protein
MKIFHVAIALCAMTGVAGADAHAEKKKAPDAPAKDAKKAPEAPKKVEAPKPAAEIEALSKELAGNWKCKGEGFGMDGSKSAITATSKAKLDLDKFWIAESLEVKGTMSMKMQMFTTYDASAKKWRRVAVDNWGTYMHGTSDGMKDKKMSWTLDTVGAMGTGQFRDHVDASDAKAGMKAWGEMSMDKGKTWVKVYEMTCKK